MYDKERFMNLEKDVVFEWLQLVVVGVADCKEVLDYKDRVT